MSRAGRNPGVWAVGYAADALEERPRIESLLEATGYVPVFLGTLAESSLLDPGGSVFPHLFTAGDLQRLAAVHRLPRMLERFNAGDMSEVLHDKVQWSFPYGPTLGVQETFVGKETVAGHLRRVRDSGVRSLACTSSSRPRTVPWCTPRECSRLLKGQPPARSSASSP